MKKVICFNMILVFFVSFAISGTFAQGVPNFIAPSFPEIPEGILVNSAVPLGSRVFTENGLVEAQIFVNEQGEIILPDPEIQSFEREIEQREEKIQKTEAEIKALNGQLEKISEEKRSLKRDLSTITVTNRRILAELQRTKDVIYKGELNLNKLNSSIESNVDSVEVLYSVLEDTYRRANEFELEDDLFLYLNSKSFFELGRKVNENERVSSNLFNRLRQLERETINLYKNRDNIQNERVSLEKNKKELNDRQKIYGFSISEKTKLIDTTENSEVAYQKLLLEKLNERVGLQQEIFEYESKIDFKKDPNAVPKPRPGILAWPLNQFYRISQAFGSTPFARKNQKHYGRPFHDGVDVSIPTGTEVFSSGSGKIVGIGNTDLVKSCQSWGKWILVEHDNGLSTLYAHLSLIKVRLGQEVKAKELIAYSGNTGFSTGPHLHYGVYISSGIEVLPYEKISASYRCRGLIVPVAAQAAKLDPIEYLPKV